MTDRPPLGPSPPALRPLFSCRGRTGRLPFAIGLGVGGAATLALVYVSIALAGNDQGAAGGALSAAAFVLALLALWPLGALLARRLHDMDRSGWHAVWIAALWLSPNLMPDALSMPATLAALAVLIWLVAMPGRLNGRWAESGKV